MRVEFIPVECDDGPIFYCLAISENDAIDYYLTTFDFKKALPLGAYCEIHHITPAALKAIKENGWKL